MQSQLRDKNDIKIFILHLLRHISYPLDFVSINDIVVQDGFVGYFDFVECFAELLETGNVLELPVGEVGEELYEITPQGAIVAETLDSRILPSIREKSLKSAMRFLSFRERGAKVKFDFEPLPNDLREIVVNDGSYTEGSDLGQTPEEILLHGIPE